MVSGWQIWELTQVYKILMTHSLSAMSTPHTKVCYFVHIVARELNVSYLVGG
jgi:hypothetical protein